MFEKSYILALEPNEQFQNAYDVICTEYQKHKVGSTLVSNVFQVFCEHENLSDFTDKLEEILKNNQIKTTFFTGNSDDYSSISVILS